MPHTDAERLDFLEQAARKSKTGISFDYISKYQQSPYGFRFMRCFFVGNARRDIRSAIDACIDEVSNIQKGEKQNPDPEPQTIPRFEPIKREDLIRALIAGGMIANSEGRWVNGRRHDTDLHHAIDAALSWLNDLQLDEPDGCTIFKVPTPELNKLRELLNTGVVPANTSSFEAFDGTINSYTEGSLTLDEGTYFANAGFGPLGSNRASAIAAVLNFVRKLI